jgi:hypothetical protein
MSAQTLELSSQAPQAITDLHRIALGLESRTGDQCIYALSCFDACVLEGIVNPTREEGLWSRCEAALLELLQISLSGPLLTHVLHSLSLSLQMSDPESDILIPRLIDILLGETMFTVRERQIALRCLSMVELDESESRSFQRALVLVFQSDHTDSGVELQTVAVSLTARYISEMPADSVEILVSEIIQKLSSTHGTLNIRKTGQKLILACLGVLHLILEIKPEAIQQSRGLLISTLTERLLGRCGCVVGPCECCQACVSCLLRIGVHPVMREDLRPFVDAVLQIAWNWKSGSSVAAQSLLNMISGLLH